MLDLLEQNRAQTARANLIEYVRQIEVPGAPLSDEPDEEEFYPIKVQPAKHHRIWLNLLQKIKDGTLVAPDGRVCRRVMGFMPPGSAKSTYTSVVFPTNVMGDRPGTNIIQLSYGSDLSRKFGRRSRQIVRSRTYQLMFDTALSADSGAADEWSLQNGSEWMCGGILSGITGNRCDGLIWDDLIKGREQADSETIRNKTWDAYVDDALTRKKPSAWEVGIITRWHEDDPAGRILPEEYDGESGFIECRDGNLWYVLCLPAICEHEDDPLGRKVGDRIWPEWFGEDHFKPFMRIPRTWSALYQQRPAPEEGVFFQRSWFEWYDKPPTRLYKYGASDYAVTDDDGDYTVHVVAGMDENKDVYVLDLWRDQSTSDVWIDGFLDLVDQHEPLNWAEEQGQIIKSVGPFIDRRMDEREIWQSREQFTSTRDKPTRARSFQAMAASGKIYLPRHAEWSHILMNELLTFPAGKHDDIVDALSLLCRMLDSMIGAAPKPKEERTKDKWDRAFDKAEETRGSWRTK